MRKTSIYARKRMGTRQIHRTYGMWSELYASTTKPMPVEKRVHQLSRMWQGLNAMERADTPSKDDWRVCSDAVNIMETLITTNDGRWLDCDGGTVHVQDANGLLMDAITAMALAGKRNLEGKNIRLDAKGLVAVRGVLEDYALILETLPERELVKAHRLTENRIIDMLEGRAKPHDVEIIDL